MKNLVALKTGGATRRPGTQYVSTTKVIKGVTPSHDFAVRLIKFIYSPAVTFIIEMGHQYVRFYQNGTPVTVSSAAAWVSGTHYYPGNFVTDPFDSKIYISTASFVSTVNPASDGTNWLQQNILELPTPYNAAFDPAMGPYNADIYGVKFCQINDVVYLAHPNYPVQRLTTYSLTNWVWEKVAFLSPPFLDANATTITMNASALTGDGVDIFVNTTAWAAAQTYRVGDSVNNASLIYVCLRDNTSTASFANDFNSGYWVQNIPFTAQNVGGYIQLTHVRPAGSLVYNINTNGTSSSIAMRGDWSWQSYGTWSADLALQQSNDNGATWNTIKTISGRSDTNFILSGTSTNNAMFQIVVTNFTGVSSTTPPRTSFTYNSSTLNGIGLITSYVSGSNVKVSVIEPFYSVDPTTLWNEGAWSDRRGYPQALTSFQSRMVYGSSGYQPQRIWMSIINDIENFALGDQSLATDSVQFDLNAPSGGSILWLIAQVDLFAGLSGQEWIINSGTPGTGGSAITPTNISASQQSSWGSAQNLPGITVGDGIFYSQRNGTTIRQLQFSISTQKYMSQDLMTLSQHLSTTGIKSIDFQPQFENQGVVWIINGLGQLCGMTYELEQQVLGWHRHITGEDQVTVVIGGTSYSRLAPDSFEAVACIPGSGNNDDEVWVVVARYAPGSVTPVRYIERMNPVNWQVSIATPTTNQAFYVDCGTQYTSPSSTTFTGLNRLANRPVVACVNSQQVINLMVSNAGTVTLPNYEPTTGDVVSIGLAINYALQPMRLDSDPRVGNTQGLTKTISDVYVRLYNSLGGSVQSIQTGDDGPVYGTITPINYRNANDPLGQAPSLFTGEKKISPFSDYSTDASFAIMGSDPLPLTVLALIVKYDLSGTP